MEHRLQGLRRYFPSVDNLASASPLFLMRCLLFRSDDLLSGFAVIYEGRLLTFTDDDCLVADIRQGNPRVGLLEDVSECSVQSPSGFPVSSTTYVRHEPIPSPRSDAVSIVLTFGEGEEAGDEALMASIGVGGGLVQQQTAERTIGTFISHVDVAMSNARAAVEDYEWIDPAGAVREMLAHPAPAAVEEGVAQHFAAGGVRDMSNAVQAPAKLYLDEDFLPGLLVVAGHILGYFPEGHAGINTEQEPLLVSFRDITDIHLSVPEGLELVIPKGVRSSTILKGNILGLYMSMQTTHISLILDFPREENAEQERGRIRSFISALLAQFANNRMN